MSQTRKNLKVVAIACLILGLCFSIFCIIGTITYVGTNVTMENLAVPDDFVSAATGAIGVHPMIGVFVKAVLAIAGFWSGWAGVQGGNVPSKAKTSMIVCFVCCLIFIAGSAYFWIIDAGLDTGSLVFAIIGAIAELAAVIFSRMVYTESLDALQ